MLLASFVPLAQSIVFRQDVSFSQKICKVSGDRIPHQRRDSHDVVAFAEVGDKLSLGDVAVVNDGVVAVTESGVTNALAELKNKYRLKNETVLNLDKNLRVLQLLMKIFG